MFTRGSGLRDASGTPTPYLGPESPTSNVSDTDITRLQSIGLMMTPPRRNWVVDMMGEDLVGDLPHFLSELKLQLQALSPPKPPPEHLLLGHPDGELLEGPNYVQLRSNRAGFQSTGNGGPNGWRTHQHPIYRNQDGRRSNRENFHPGYIDQGPACYGSAEEIVFRPSGNIDFEPQPTRRTYPRDWHNLSALLRDNSAPNHQKGSR